MSKKIIKKIFNEYIKKGLLTLELPTNGKLVFGNLDKKYPEVTIKVKNELFFNEIVNRGNLGIGESYMKEYFSMLNSEIFEFLDLLLLNEIDKAIKSNSKLMLSIAYQRIVDSFKGKSYNIKRHYDIGFDIFNLMLDQNLTYSCGYLINEKDSLNDLQYQKFQRIIDKIQLQKEDKVLDIGCGYGSFLIYAAQNYGITGIGVTNSEQHAKFANKKIKERNLEKLIQVVVNDYKNIEGSFDKIVSIGMLEHVPRKEYNTYFKLIKKMLLPSGSSLIHAVGCNTYKNFHDPFIQKYIFPNSNQPQLSEIAHQIEKNEMAIIDVENIIRHYRPTSYFWLKNFLQNKDEITKKSNYTKEFLYAWEYYLNCCVSAAKYSDSAVYQVLINKSHLTHISYERI